MKKLELRVFRFDKDKDYESYFKPYVYETYESFATLFDLLLQVQDDDIYFHFNQDENSYILVNNEPFKLSSNLASIVQNQGFELVISPLCEKRAIKDLIINKDDFLKKFKPFEKYCDAEDKRLYESLDYLYYKSGVLELLPDFVGDSAIYFVAKMIQKYPNLKLDLLKLVSSVENGAFYHIKTSNLELEEAVKVVQDELLKSNLFDKNLIKAEVKTTEFDKPCLNEVKHDFIGFNIASFGFEPCESLKQKLEAKFIKTQSNFSGYEFLSLNSNLAYKIAANAMLEAYDLGADFMLVKNESDFYIFDECSKALQSMSGWEFSDFYVLRVSEFLDLISGKRPVSLKEHKLKVSL